MSAQEQSSSLTSAGEYGHAHPNSGSNTDPLSSPPPAIGDNSGATTLKKETTAFTGNLERISSLREDLDTIKAEVDALQIATAHKHVPIYRNVPVIVSILALLFSFGTTAVSYRRTTLEDIQSSRQELRDILQRLAALPMQNFEAQERFSDVRKAASVSGFINQENSLLAKQAVEIASRIPDHISSPEYMAIAIALENSMERGGMLEHLARAIETADNANDEITALRMYGAHFMKNGNPEKAESILEEGLAIFDKYPNNDESMRDVTHLQTHLFWANMLFAHGIHDKARNHALLAEQFLEKLPPGPFTDQLAMQVRQLKNQIHGMSANGFLGGGTMGTLPLRQDANPDPF